MYAIVFHAHQKLDRAAHRHLIDLLPEDSFFPSIRQILKFEAGHGPDSAKLKRHDKSEQPWHFIDPFDEKDTALDKQIQKHYKRLVIELRNKDSVRSSFEAAWLAHALVDGLTPAHHYPYEAELERLRGGEPRDSRKGLSGRLYVKSDSVTSTIHRSLKLIGPRGLLTSHAMFEAGAYTIIAPLRFTKARPTKEDLDKVTKDGIVKIFRQNARDVAKLNLYASFCEDGWIKPVTKGIRNELAPKMVNIITMAWYAAAQEATKS
jgi:hypothetical protein